MGEGLLLFAPQFCSGRTASPLKYTQEKYIYKCFILFFNKKCTSILKAEMALEPWSCLCASHTPASHHTALGLGAEGGVLSFTLLGSCSQTAECLGVLSGDWADKGWW